MLSATWRLLLVGVLLSSTGLTGCLGDSTLGSATTEDGADTPPRAAARIFALDDCSQLHTFYDSPAQNFEPFVPDGFALEYTDPEGLLVTVSVAFTFCPEGPSEAVVSVPVVPPAHMDVEADGHRVPIEVHVSHPELRAAYEHWGLEALLFNADVVSSVHDTVVGRSNEVAVQGDAGVYTVRAKMAHSSGAFQDETFVLWVPDGDGGVDGHVTVRTTNATNVAAGSATLSYEGQGGAPPVAQGVAHEVASVDLVWAPEAL